MTDPDTPAITPDHARPDWLNAGTPARSALAALTELLIMAALVTWLLVVVSLSALMELREHIVWPQLARRLLDPLLLRVDFTQTSWALTPWAARAWLAGAVVADLAVQFVAGEPTWWTVLFSLLTLVCFWYVPPRLTGAVGALYIMQALGSLAVVLLLAAFTDELAIINVGVLLWWAWCVFALVKLILAYLRTPKAQMKA